MKKSELRKLMVKENTIMKARKELQQITKYIDEEEREILVRVFNSSSDNIMYADLIIDVNDMEEGEWKSIYVATIELEEDKMDWWQFVEDTRDIFKTMKKNLVAEIEKYGYEITSTEDYNM